MSPEQTQFSRAVLLVYDIPERSGVGNPSSKLRKLGFRVNLSAWVLPEHLVPWNLIGNLRDRGAKVETVRFAETAMEEIQRLGRMALEAEAARIAKLLGDMTEREQKKLAEAEREQSVDGIAKAGTYVKSTIRRAKAYLTAAKSAAALFGLTADLSDLLDGVHKTIGSEVERRMLTKA